MSRTRSDSVAWAVSAARPMTRAIAVGPARRLRCPLVGWDDSWDMAINSSREKAQPPVVAARVLFKDRTTRPREIARSSDDPARGGPDRGSTARPPLGGGAGPPGPDDIPTPPPRQAGQPAAGMDHDRPADPFQQGSIAPIIRIRGRIVHRDSVRDGPLLGPVPLPLAVTCWIGANSDEPTSFDHHRGRQHVGAAEVKAQGLDHDAGRRRDEDDLRPGPSQLGQVLDHPLIKPGTDELDKIIIGDPLQLDDRNPRDALQAEGHEPAVIEVAELVLQPVVHRA